MSSVDQYTWIGSSAVAAAVAFIILGLARFTKTSDKTITGSIRIEGLQQNLEDLKKDMEKAFTRVERTLADNNDEAKRGIEKIGDRLDMISDKTNINEYRLTQLEKNNRNGGHKAPI